MEDDDIPTTYQHPYTNSKGELGFMDLNVIPTNDPKIYKIDTVSDDSKKKFESEGITPDEVNKLSNLEVEYHDGHFIPIAKGGRRRSSKRKSRKSRKTRKSRKARKARTTRRK